MENKFVGRESHLQDSRISNFEAHWNTQFLDASLEDWLTYLRKQNDKVMLPLQQTTNITKDCLLPSVYYFAPPTVAEIVFKWCQQLKQPIGVLHRTVDIYDRFICAYSVSKSAMKLSKTGLPDKCHWEEFYTEMKHQSLLHLISCLQIASKLENGYTVVTVSEAAALLRQSLRPCDPSTIISSEVLVLVTLGHDVNYPPISDYVDTFICQLIYILKRKSPTDDFRQLLLVIDEIHDITMVFIRTIFFHQQMIVQRIVARFNGETGREETTSEYNSVHRRVKLDKILLATGAILAATYIIQPCNAANLMKELHIRTGAHPSELAVVSSVLIDYLETEGG